MIRGLLQPIWMRFGRFAALFALSLLLAQCTVWKESQEFWLNSGGYPVWLRDCVRVLYYPYLFFVLVAAITLSRSVCVQFFKQLRLQWVWFVLIATWVVLLASLGLLFTNNIINVFNLRPIHYHEPIGVLIWLN